MEERIIVGIDPGTRLMGFGVIRAVGRRAEFVDMGVLDLRKETDAYAKLRQIYETVGEVCKTYHATDMALESPFLGKNAQVVLKLGRAQGAAMIAALEYGIPVHEYAPRKAKVAITGNGAASKEQVNLMLSRTLDVDLTTRHLDATDALAIALCHFYELSSPLSGASSGRGSRRSSAKGSWERYLQEHPERVK